MQPDFNCVSVPDVGARGGVRLWIVCANRTHVVHKHIQLIMLTKASLYTETTVYTQCGTSTISPFERYNSPTETHTRHLSP